MNKTVMNTEKDFPHSMNFSCTNTQKKERVDQMNMLLSFGFLTNSYDSWATLNPVWYAIKTVESHEECGQRLIKPNNSSVNSLLLYAFFHCPESNDKKH